MRQTIRKVTEKELEIVQENYRDKWWDEVCETVLKIKQRKQRIGINVKDKKEEQMKHTKEEGRRK